MRRVLLLVPLLLAACADSVTEPSPPIPAVAGQYSGTVSPAFFGSATTSVTQSRTTVTIEPLHVNAPVVCPIIVPFGDTTIDHTGAFRMKSGTFSVCHCLFHYTATGGFVERELRISLHGVSPSTADLGEDELPPDGCYDYRFDFNLTRQ
jgi:hypothetical protein